MAVSASQRSFAYRLNYYWRILITGLSFALFGVGGVLIAVLMTAFYYLTPFSTNTKQRMARKMISAIFRLYVNFMRQSGILTFEIRGEQYLSVPGRLVVANHPSLLDVVFLISIIRNADCIVRQGLRRNPFMRGPILSAGYMGNDDPELVVNCSASLARGSELIVFPEGTRTSSDGPLKFQRGAANIAISSRCDITPILIECNPATLRKHQRWYQIPPSPPHFIFTVLPPIAIAPYLNGDEVQGRRARKLTAFLERYFMESMSVQEGDATGPSCS